MGTRIREPGNGICPNCGTAFFQHGGKRFCSKTCNYQFHYAQKKMQRAQDKAEYKRLMEEMEAAKKLRQKARKSIAQIQREADAAGMTYGQYVAIIGG